MRKFILCYLCDSCYVNKCVNNKSILLLILKQFDGMIIKESFCI